MQHTILIDITTHCNLDCIFCYRGQENHHKLYNHLNLSEVKKLFDRNSKYLDVSLINKGEMFVNPDFMEIFRYIIQEAYFNPNIRSVFLFTNGTLFKPDYTDEFLKILTEFPVKFRVNFSLNAVRPETYRLLTGKDLIASAYSNTEYYIRKAFEWNVNNRDLLEAVPQSLILKENRYELIEFIEYWEDFFNKNNIPFEICEDTCISEYSFVIALKRVYLGNPDDNQIFYNVVDEIKKVKSFRINENVESGLDYFRRKACDFLFNQPVMNEEWVTICCRDLYFDYKYRKIDEKTSEKEIIYKNSHIMGEFENIRICEDCFNYRVLSTEDAIKYAQDRQHFIMYEHRLKKGIPFEFYSVDGETYLVERFLSKNDFVGYSSRTCDESEYIMYKDKEYLQSKNNEEDFCVFWKARLSIDKNGIFSGCRKQIYIKDFKEFSAKLENSDYSLIPDACIKCPKKMSYNGLRDRFRIFSDKNFSSPVIKKSDYYDNIFNLKKCLQHKDEHELSDIVKKNNNYSFFKELFNNIRKFEFDSTCILDLFLKTQNLFLIKDYSIWSENYFERSVLYQLENIRHILFEEQTKKLIIYYIDNRLKNEKIIKKTSDIIQKYNNDIMEIFQKKENIDDFIVFMRKKIDSLNNIDDFVCFFNSFKNILILKYWREEFEYKIVFFIKKGEWKKLKNIIECIDFNEFFQNSEIAEETAERIVSEYCDETEDLENLQRLVIRIQNLLKYQNVVKKIVFLMVRLCFLANTKDIIELFDKKIKHNITDKNISDIFYENAAKAILNKIKDANDLNINKHIIINICNTQSCYEMLFSFVMEIMSDKNIEELFKFFIPELIKDQNGLYEDMYKNLIVKYIYCVKDIKKLLNMFSADSLWFQNNKIKNTFTAKIIELSQQKDNEDTIDIFVNSDYFSLNKKSVFVDLTKNLIYNYLQSDKKKNLYINKAIISKTITFINKNTSQREEFCDYIIDKIFCDKSDFYNIESLLQQISDNVLYNKQYFLYKQKIAELMNNKRFYTILIQLKKFKVNFYNSILYDVIVNSGFRHLNYRFLRLLIYLDKMYADDNLKHKIYSFYMSIEDFRSAGCWMSKIDHPELFWSDKEFVSTLEFLEIHTGTFLEKLRKRIFKFLK